MSQPPWAGDETLYADAARHYVVGRMPYPSDLGERIVAAAGLDRRARALDVGCGPGPLSLLLAGSVRAVVGVDADRGMIEQARVQARRARVENVSWRQLRGEDLPADLGRFELVTFAQSFHWMARERVAAIVAGMLVDGGSCVQVHATTNRGDSSEDPLPRPRPPYAAIDALVREFLGTVRRAGRSRVVGPPPSGEDKIYRAAGFEGPQRVEVPQREVVERTIDEVVAATFSLSSSTPHLFEHRRGEFEARLRSLLADAALDGRFCERRRDVAFDVWRGPRGAVSPGPSAA